LTTTVYLGKFNTSTEVTNLYKAKWFKALPPAEQDTEVNKRYLAFVQGVERDKLFHFVMACDQPNPVLIIRSPTETKAIKQFLGYEWSSAKGDEGIKLIKDAHGRHLTPLYDEINRDNGAKLNSLVSANFDGKLSIPESLAPFAVAAALTDMLDFSRVTFEKQLSITPNRVKTTVSSKWPNTKLASVAQILNGGTPSTSEASFWEGGDICWATLVDTKQKYLVDTKRKITSAGLKHTTLLPINTVIFSSRATIGEVCINKVPTTTNQGYKNFVCDPTKLNFEYLYQILVHLHPVLVDLVPAGSKYKEINGKTIADFEIPLPPLNVQQQIVSECGLVDESEDSARAQLESLNGKIGKSISDIYESAAPFLEIDKLAIDIQYGLNEAMNEGGVGYKIFRMNEIIRGRMVDNGSMKCADISAEAFAKYKLNKGDLLFIRSNGSLEHIGKVGLFDLDGDYCYASYLVRIVPDSSKVLPRYLGCIMNSEIFRKGMVSLAVKSGGTNNINATKMKNIKVPVPTLPEQKKFVARIEALEKEIADAQAVIDGAAARKQAILQKYL